MEIYLRLMSIVVTLELLFIAIAHNMSSCVRSTAFDILHFLDMSATIVNGIVTHT